MTTQTNLTSSGTSMSPIEAGGKIVVPINRSFALSEACNDVVREIEQITRTTGGRQASAT